MSTFDEETRALTFGRGLLVEVARDESLPLAVPIAREQFRLILRKSNRCLQRELSKSTLCPISWSSEAKCFHDRVRRKLFRVNCTE